MDNLTMEQRSRQMGLVRSQNTKPEIAVRRYLHGLGLRFRLHRKDLPGSPDIILPKFKTVIFVHGCFWHVHKGCPNARMPKSRIEFWTEKFAQNQRRDSRVKKRLRKLGWNTVVVWECESHKAEVICRKIRRVGILKETQDAIT